MKSLVVSLFLVLFISGGVVLAKPTSKDAPPKQETPDAKKSGDAVNDPAVAPEPSKEGTSVAPPVEESKKEEAEKQAEGEPAIPVTPTVSAPDNGADRQKSAENPETPVALEGEKALDFGDLLNKLLQRFTSLSNGLLPYADAAVKAADEEILISEKLVWKSSDLLRNKIEVLSQKTAELKKLRLLLQGEQK